MFRKSIIAGIASLVAGALLASAPAAAVPVLWSLQDMTFNDGGTASGTFVFDADTNTYSNISITTTAGSSRPGATYGIPAPDFATDPFTLSALEAAPAVGVSILFFEWASALTNAGGTVASSSANELECLDALCGILTGPGRFSSDSFVTAVAVPEPGTLTMLGLGLAALGVAWRRKES